MQDTNDLTYKTQTYRLNELMVARGECMGGRVSSGVWDRHIHTALFKMDNQQGPTV